MKTLTQGLFTGERALYNSRELKIYDSTFADGESPLKESRDIEINSSIFKWKYPLWYCKNIKLSDSTLLETARSGIWYTDNIEITDTVIGAPKTFRRASNIKITRSTMPLAQESLWSCRDVHMETVFVKGDYFGMNSENIYADGLEIDGNYAFDGGRNIEIHNARLISKDSFWNCENVTVYDSVIIGEYIGWNSKNVTLVNCTVESNQGFCYMENVKLVNCKLLNTDLAFEYSTVEAEVTTEIDSVKNPYGGKIRAKKIGEIIMEENLVDVTKTEITVEEE
jgi:hypothetical protein